MTTRKTLECSFDPKWNEHAKQNPTPIPKLRPEAMAREALRDVSDKGKETRK